MIKRSIKSCKYIAGTGQINANDAKRSLDATARTINLLKVGSIDGCAITSFLAWYNNRISRQHPQSVIALKKIYWL